MFATFKDLQILLCHLERKTVHSDDALSVIQGSIHQCVYLLDRGIGHGITANRHVIPVNHEVIASPTMVAIKLIRIPQIH